MENYDLDEGKNTYEVTVTRTGSVTTRADSPEDAFEKVNSLSAKEVDEVANLTGWEASDVECIE